MKLFNKKATAILGGLIFFKTGSNQDGKCVFDQRGIANISFALFYTVTVTVIVSLLAAVMAFPSEIPIYYREHASSVYRSDTYYFSKLLNEVNKTKIPKTIGINVLMCPKRILVFLSHIETTF